MVRCRTMDRRKEDLLLAFGSHQNRRRISPRTCPVAYSFAPIHLRASQAKGALNRTRCGSADHTGDRSNRDLQRDFLKRHARHFDIALAAGFLGNAHQPMPFQQADVLLNILEVTLYQFGKLVQ